MTLLFGSDAQPLSADHPDYTDLARLEAQLLEAVGGKRAFEEKLRSFFRSAIDEVIDTARTGRFTLDQLEKLRRPISARNSKSCCVTGCKSRAE
jgi:hypothetical protein